MYFKLATYSVVVYHLKNILLNFQWKMWHLEKKMFCGDGRFSALDHLTSKNQIVFVILWVSPGNPAEFFFFTDFSSFGNTRKRKTRFSLKKSVKLLL